MRFVRSVITLSVKELRLLFRDKQAAALLFGMPALLILALSLALEDVYDDKVGTKLKVILAVEDQGERARVFRDTFAAESGFDLVARPAGRTDGELFRTGVAHAVVRIPDGFSIATEEFFRARGGEDGLGSQRIAWTTSPSLDASYRWLLQSKLATVCAKMVRGELARGRQQLVSELEQMGGRLTETATQLEVAASQLQQFAGIDPKKLQEIGVAATLESAAAREAEALRKELGISSAEDAPESAQRSGLIGRETAPVRIEGRDGSRPAPPPEDRLQLRPRGAVLASDTPVEGGPELFLRHAVGERLIVPTPLQQTVPGWALFAMFFLVVPLAQGLHRERLDGSMRRVLSLAVPRSAIVLGKLFPFVLVGLLQFGAMLAVGLWVVPRLGNHSLEMGAQPLVLIPIAVACSFAATAYAMLVATWSRTADQAAAFGATSVIILAVLGGIMVPHFMMPETLREIAVASPLYWGHKACLDAFLHGAGLAEVTDSLTFLGGFAVVCLLLSVRRVTS